MQEYYDAADVKDSISGRLKSIISDLLPEAKIAGGEARVGSLSGEKGKSMAISLNPSKMGAFYDHASGDSGDLFDILQEVKGLDYPEAIDYLAHHYTSCVKRPWESSSINAKKITNPEALIAKITPQVIEYMQATRKVSQATLTNYEVASVPNQPTAAAFLHFQNNQVSKISCWQPAGKKWWAVGDGGNGLFGAKYVTTKLTKGRLIITEGQNDAMACAEVGYPAVSIPSGVSNAHWISECWEYLQEFHTITLCFDEDDKGIEARDVAVKRLGVSKCLVTSLPLKDASDMLQGGRGEELADLLERAQPPEQTDVAPATDFEDDVQEILSQDLSLIGDKMFIPELNHRIRENEMTVIYGREFAGKSVFISNQMAYDAAKGIATAIGSFEQKPRMTLANMLTQFSGNKDIGQQENYKQWFRAMAEHIHIYKETESPTPQRIIEEFAYLYKRKGIRRFVVDNWSAMDLGDDSNGENAKAINLFRSFVNEYPVHVFIVMHPRKTGREYVNKESDRNEIRGAGQLVQLSHNVILVHRNEGKSDSIFEMIKDKRPDEAALYDQNEPDGKIKVQKNRFLGTTPQADVWFANETKTFMNYRGQPVSMPDVARAQEPELF
tara:strand:- start:10671 stop:12503 length:1833 start_codon:yes stop_codon:yes gene_type:complete